ncbi:MAG: hypothetical protein IJW67_08910 [Blautia sp.]|nr:hypothetical protein [Blautia sp.]
MYRNEFYDKIRKGETVYGFSVNYPHPVIIETITEGWDYIWLDAQHGHMSYPDLMPCMIAAEAVGIGTIIRVPGHDFSVVGPIADLNPSAIMIPMVNNAKEAKEVSEHLHFPPLGHRSFWNTRIVHRVGGDYDQTQDLMVLAQIETAEAVENAEEIIATEGIDALMFGPSDLALSYGLRPGTGRHGSEKIQAAAERVIKAAKAVG